MKICKTVSAVFLTLLLLISFSACGGGGGNDESSIPPPTPSAIGSGSIKGIIGMAQSAAEIADSFKGFGPKAQATDLTLLTVRLIDGQGFTSDTHPDASGRFSFESIPAGYYVLSIEANEAFPSQGYYPNAFVTVETDETLYFSIPAVRGIPLGITDFLPSPDAEFGMRSNVSQTVFSTLDINDVSGKLLLSNNSSRLVRVTDSGPEAESQNVEVFEVNGALLGKDDTEELLYFRDTISVDGQEECHIYVRSGVNLSIVTDLNFETVCPAAAIDETNNRLYLYAEADSKLTIVENGLERAEVDITGISGTMIVSENNGGVLYFTSERMISTLNGSDGARLGDVDFYKPGMGAVQNTVVNPATGELYVTYGAAKRGWDVDEPWLLIVSGSGGYLVDGKLSDVLGCVPTDSSGGSSGGVSVSASEDGGSASDDSGSGSGSGEEWCMSQEEMEAIHRCSAARIDYYSGGYDSSYDDSPTLLFFREDESNMVYINGIKFSVSGADFAVIIPPSEIDEDDCVSSYYPVRLFFPRGKVIDYTRDFYYGLQTNLDSEWWYEGTGYLGVGRYPMDDNSDIMVYVGLLHQDQAGLSGLVVNRGTGRVYTFDPNSNELLVLE